MLEVFRASGPLIGQLAPPGDKSISHRALIFAALADGESHIKGLLMGQDVLATKSALEQLGVSISIDESGVTVHGIGIEGLKPPAQPLDMGNSGTAMRLLSGVLAAQLFSSELFGDESLSKRPMNRIFKPLREMGAEIEGDESNTPPIRISGRKLTGIHYESPVASAQIKSCVLLAGLFATGQTSVSEPATSRDHTERMLPVFGVKLPGRATVRGGSRLNAANFTVPADISSAAFLLAAASIIEGSSITLSGVGLNPTRDGFLRCLKAMGADIEYDLDPELITEPVGDIRIRYKARLNAIDVPPEWVPSMIDEIPVLMILAATAKGITKVRGAAELRVKESDRLSVMAEGLKLLGVGIKEYEDGFDIQGRAVFNDAEVESSEDHRCAMSFAVLGLRAPSCLRIRDAEYIATSYPGFISDMTSLGARLKMVDTA